MRNRAPPMNGPRLLRAAIVAGMGLCQAAGAQDMFITNARMIVGGGDVIERGGIVIRSGRIAAVTEEELEFTVSEARLGELDLPVLDAAGLTVMAGFIDGHRQLIQGDPDAWLEEAEDRMREYLEAGITTVLSVDRSLDHILELRDRLELDEIVGPRLFMSGPVPQGNGGGRTGPEDAVREAIRELALTGADGVAATVRAAAGDAGAWALAVAKEAADEQGLLLIAHVEGVEDAIAAVEGGSGYLTGTPHVGELDEAAARRIADLGRPNAEYDMVVTSALGRARADAAGTAAANARALRDAGVIYGFGTGTTLPPGEALRREVTALESVFSSGEILDILTRSAAYSMRRDDALGDLRAGRMADIVMLDGDPLTDLDALYNVKVVIRNGRVAVDRRMLGD